MGLLFIKYLAGDDKGHLSGVRLSACAMNVVWGRFVSWVAIGKGLVESEIKLQLRQRGHFVVLHYDIIPCRTGDQNGHHW